MNLASILKAVKDQGNSKVFNQAEVLNSGIDDIKRHEMKKDSLWVWAVPLTLQFPFHPTDFMNEEYSAANPFVFPCSPTEGVIALKEEMRKSPEVHEYYASLIKKTVETYNINEDVITEDDMEIFKRFRLPLQLSTMTQKVTTAEAGQYGREFKTPLKKDADGYITEDTAITIPGRMLAFENAIRDEKAAEYLTAVDKSKLTKDQKEALTTIRRSSCLSYPKLSGVTFILEFMCNSKTETLEKFESSIEDNLRYLNCNREVLAKFTAKVNKKNDKYFDYLLLQVQYGSDKGDGKESPEIILYKSREYSIVREEDDINVRSQWAVEKDSTASPEESFDLLMREFITNGMLGDFRKYTKQIYKFRPLTAEILLRLFSERVREVEAYITDDVFALNRDVLDMVNPEFTAILTAKAKAKTLPTSFKKNVLTGEVIDKDLEKALSDLQNEDKALGSEDSDASGLLVDEDDITDLIES